MHSLERRAKQLLAPELVKAKPAGPAMAMALNRIAKASDFLLPLAAKVSSQSA
jgi:hypothetical protein